MSRKDVQEIDFSMSVKRKTHLMYKAVTVGAEKNDRCSL